MPLLKCRQKKRALETASVTSDEAHQPTVISSADGAKVLKNLDKLVKNGRIVTIRLADHNATVSNFDLRGELDGISIIVNPYAELKHIQQDPEQDTRTSRDQNGVLHHQRFLKDGLDRSASDTSKDSRREASLRVRR